ncbi:carbohydrate ABC transporter permease, partial [Blautia pseudococcoides]|nr:carbohydrate ABC transporter permease [Blautia pseudococcoides]
LTIAFTLILSAMATYAIVRLKWKLSKLVYFIFLTGMMLSIHAVLLPLFVNMKPVLDTYWALIIPYVAFAMPTAILLMVGTLESLPKELEEAAFIDGANIYRVFWQIIMPLLKPILSTVAILTFLSAWNEMMLAIAFVSGEKYKTITVGVNDMVGKYSTKWGLIGAGLTIATIPTLFLYVFLSKNIQKSLAMGAVKG